MTTNQTTIETEGRGHGRARMRRFARGLAALGAVGGTLAGTLALAAPDAGAAVSALSAPGPTFGCTATTLNIAQVALNDDIGTVRVQAEVDVWTGTKWALDGASPVDTVNTNQAFSGLAGPSFNFAVAPGRYYDVFIWTSVNGAAWGYYPAQALRDAYSNYVCLTR